MPNFWVLRRYSSPWLLNVVIICRWFLGFSNRVGSSTCLAVHRCLYLHVAKLTLSWILLAKHFLYRSPHRFLRWVWLLEHFSCPWWMLFFFGWVPKPKYLSYRHNAARIRATYMLSIATLWCMYPCAMKWFVDRGMQLKGTCELDKRQQTNSEWWKFWIWNVLKESLKNLWATYLNKVFEKKLWKQLWR